MNAGNMYMVPFDMKTGPMFKYQQFYVYSSDMGWIPALPQTQLFESGKYLLNKHDLHSLYEHLPHLSSVKARKRTFMLKDASTEFKKMIQQELQKTKARKQGKRVRSYPEIK